MRRSWTTTVSRTACGATARRPTVAGSRRAGGGRGGGDTSPSPRVAAGKLDAHPDEVSIPADGTAVEVVAGEVEIGLVGHRLEVPGRTRRVEEGGIADRQSTRLNSSH